MSIQSDRLSEYFKAKQNRRRKTKHRQKRLDMGLPAAVPLKRVSLNQEEKKAIASTEVIGTAKRKRLFVSRHFGWPVSLGIHLFAGFLLTFYAVTEYIPEEVPVFLDFMEPTREPRKLPPRPIKPTTPTKTLRIETPRIQRSAPTAVEIPTEEAEFYTPTDDLIDAGDAPTGGGVSIPEGFGTIQVQQHRAEVPTETPGVKIERDTSIAPEDAELDDIADADLGGRSIDAEVQVEVDQTPRPLGKSEPKYPSIARLNNKEGVVVAEFIVGVDGRTSDITVVKEEPKGFSFGEAAIEAVKKWRFTPAKKGGKSVPMRVRQTIRFNLDD